MKNKTNLGILLESMGIGASVTQGNNTSQITNKDIQTLQLDQTLKGSGDPIKDYIDKLIDSKNKAFKIETDAKIKETVQSQNQEEFQQNQEN